MMGFVMLFVGVATTAPSTAHAGFFSSIFKAIKSVVSAVVSVVAAVVSIPVQIVASVAPNFIHSAGCFAGSVINLIAQPLGFDTRCRSGGNANPIGTVPGQAQSGLAGGNIPGFAPVVGIPGVMGGTPGFQVPGTPIIPGFSQPGLGGQTGITGGQTVSGQAVPVGFPQPGVGVPAAIPAATIVAVTTLPATTDPTDPEAPYTLNGILNITGSASAQACFQIRPASGTYGAGCTTTASVFSAPQNNISIASGPLLPGTAYGYRLIAQDLSTAAVVAGNEILFSTPQPAVFASQITSASKKVSVTFLANRPEDSNTLSLTTTAQFVFAPVFFQVGTLLTPAGSAVASVNQPQVFLDNSLTAGASKSIGTFPAITNLRLRFPHALATGTYTIPVTTLYGRKTTIINVSVAITNLDPNFKEQ